jgi:hypothetical protein
MPYSPLSRRIVIDTHLEHTYVDQPWNGKQSHEGENDRANFRWMEDMRDRHAVVHDGAALYRLQNSGLVGSGNGIEAIGTSPRKEDKMASNQDALFSGLPIEDDIRQPIDGRPHSE